MHLSKSLPNNIVFRSLLRPVLTASTTRSLRSTPQQTPSWTSWATAGPGAPKADKGVSAGQQQTDQTRRNDPMPNAPYAYTESVDGHAGDWFEDGSVPLDEPEPIVEAFTMCELRSTDGGHYGALFEDTGGEVPIAGKDQ
ncbi:hypothetical protein SpCBS45565_g01363 [Spizellomyces sp. 'palustris']|nr:hypothetical protein SpCBS45565_g01363 [Spizellomyces sp. 'palustris']